MKKISLLLFMSALLTASFAQLPNGSYAPAFTGYEIDKTTGNIISTNPISLYEMTDAGYTVFMDVFATWCGPCWNYHNTHALEDLYGQYGPEGTNEVRVLAIEGSNGNYNSLSGAGADAGGSATQGNWLSGVEYPVIPLKMAPNTMAFDNDYAIAYFPTVYMVCPNRLVYEVGQQQTGALYQASKNTCPQFDATLANNGLVLTVGGIEKVYHCSCTATPTVDLQNVGTANLTSVTFSIEFDGQTSTFDWTGNLDRYNKTTVTLPQITSNTDGTHTYTVSIATVNGNADTDTVMNTVSNSFHVAVTPTSVTINEDFSSDIPSDWCNAEDILFTYNLNGDYGKAVCFNAYNLDEGTIANLYLPFENMSSLTTPTLSFDVAHKRYNTNYTERLRVMYSTNCGQTWQSAYTKSGSSLATVTGNASSNFIPTASQWRTETIDLSNITDRDDVVIKFEFRSGYGNNVWIDNVRIANGTGIQSVESDLTIYPNPATDNITISTSENAQRVEIFNIQGQLVKAEAGNVTHISVKDLANGMYTLKLTTENGTSIHKIVKK
ncbi:MAG: T9SS type A sorting domain-containing protein [Bacteroidales bacterium]|nr:T9SS type A sorting domain-containing protein [Bacteroidales bacterium]